MKSVNNSVKPVENQTHEEVSIKDIFVTLFEYRIWFLLSLIIMVTLGLFYLASKPSIYMRKAAVIVQDEGRSGNISEAAAFQEIFNMGGGSVYNEIGLFKSNRLMYEVVNRLGLEVSYKLRDKFRVIDLYKVTPIHVAFEGFLLDQAISLAVEILDDSLVKITDIELYSQGESSEKIELDDLVDYLGSEIFTPYGSFIITPTLFMSDEIIGKQIYVSRESPKLVARRFQEALSVGLVDKYGSLISISIIDESINRADDVINGLIEVYRDDAINDKNTILSNTTKFIEERLLIIAADLTAVDAEIEEFKRLNNITDVVSEGSLYRENMSRIDDANLNIENQLNMAQYMKSYLESETNIAALLPVNIGIGDAGLQMQIVQYNENMNQRNKLLINSSANNPLVIDLQNILVGLRSSILLSINNLIANLEIKARNYTKKEVESLDRIKDIPSQQKYIINIERQQSIKEQLYLYLLNKKEESELQRSITESNCRVVDYAQGNPKPVSPNKVLVMLLCLLLGFVFPTLLIYLVRMFNTMVMTRKDVKGVLQIPFLGDIPSQKSIPSSEIVVSEGNRDAVGEAFRIVRDNIDFMNIDNTKGGSIIQLTSMNPNSGKTFVSINIAMSMALGGAKVVVVDLDIRKGTLSKIAGIGVRQSGVSQFLSGKVTEVKEIVRPFADNAHIDIISSGVLPPNPAELLRSERLAYMFDKLRGMYDYIFIDNPPYGVVVDAAICARLSDQSIYVIRAGKLDKRFLVDIQELYDAQKLPNMSVLLNGVAYKVNSYGYGYGYGESDQIKGSWVKRILGL